MEKELQKIGLTTENVEYFDIPAKYIRRFYCTGLNRELTFNKKIYSSPADQDYRIKEIYTCETVVLAFDYQAINQEQTFAIGPDGQPEGLSDRLASCHDITWLTLQYTNGQTIDIQVPWSFRSDTTNYNMFTQIKPCTENKKKKEEVILISSSERILADASFWMSRDF
ncbi:hypothetical protein [uncultured Limosilactobacillus sp.]|uniref:hypothetical protein n=1 Tax=uncultured Limosilactobacillus sp. TaxID=2837629 RepID=UPI0025EB5811|nr:hypothetical protein [uncultured Limosilactobacillus sp.]